MNERSAGPSPLPNPADDLLRRGMLARSPVGGKRAFAVCDPFPLSFQSRFRRHPERTSVSSKKNVPTTVVLSKMLSLQQRGDHHHHSPPHHRGAASAASATAETTPWFARPVSSTRDSPYQKRCEGSDLPSGNDARICAFKGDSFCPGANVIGQHDNILRAVLYIATSLPQTASLTT